MSSLPLGDASGFGGFAVWAPNRPGNVILRKIAIPLMLVFGMIALVSALVSSHVCTAALEAATSLDLADLAPFHALPADIAGRPVSLINQPLGALPGFALVLSPGDAPQVWERLAALGTCPMGIDAYEAVRVRYGVPVHGPEMGEPYNPLEAGLIGSIDFAKGCYIGQEVIARLDTYQKVQKRLVSLRFSPEADPSVGVDLQDDGKPVGTVTSAVRVPTTEETIGLGYVRTASASVGTRLELVGSEGAWVEVLELPELFGPTIKVNGRSEMLSCFLNPRKFLRDKVAMYG